MNSSATPAINGGNNGQFDGLTIAQIAMQVHAAGMKLIPLMYAGAGNSGTDQYIQGALDDSPAGTQSNLINWLVTDAKTNQYDGWNLDWEVNGSTGYSAYGMKYISFMTAAKAALHAANLTLTVDIGEWYTLQCGSDGLVDLTQIGPAVDAAIIEDYAGGLGPPNPMSPCPGGTPAASANCSPTNYLGAQLNVMCDVSPASAVSIGLNNGGGGAGADPFLDLALDDISTIGFTQVAVWPGDNMFLSPRIYREEGHGIRSWRSSWHHSSRIGASIRPPRLVAKWPRPRRSWVARAASALTVELPAGRRPFLHCLHTNPAPRSRLTPVPL